MTSDQNDELVRLRAENEQLRAENERLRAINQATQELLHQAVKALAGQA